MSVKDEIHDSSSESMIQGVTGDTPRKITQRLSVPIALLTIVLLMVFTVTNEGSPPPLKLDTELSVTDLCARHNSAVYEEELEARYDRSMRRLLQITEDTEDTEDALSFLRWTLIYHAEIVMFCLDLTASTSARESILKALSERKESCIRSGRCGHIDYCDHYTSRYI